MNHVQQISHCFSRLENIIKNFSEPKKINNLIPILIAAPYFFVYFLLAYFYTFFISSCFDNINKYVIGFSYIALTLLIIFIIPKRISHTCLEFMNTIEVKINLFLLKKTNMFSSPITSSNNMFRLIVGYKPFEDLIKDYAQLFEFMKNSSIQLEQEHVKFVQNNMHYNILKYLYDYQQFQYYFLRKEYDVAFIYFIISEISKNDHSNFTNYYVNHLSTLYNSYSLNNQLEVELKNKTQVTTRHKI
jgi:hypothetical protein